MEAKTLEGTAVSLPQNLKGKNSMLCIVYSKKSEAALESWLRPVVNTFLVSNPLDPDPFKGNMYFVIMLSGIKDVASNVIENKLKKGLDRNYWKNVVIYQGPIKDYLENLEFGKKDDPYFCVLDKNGVISYSTTGSYTDDKLQEIESKVSEE